MLDETKEILTRFAAGEIEEIPKKILVSDMLPIVDKVYTIRKEVNKVNVAGVLHRIFPDSVFPCSQIDLSTDELVSVVQAQQAKQKLIKIESKLQDALLFGKNTHNWDKTVEEIAKELSDGTRGDNDVVTFADLDFNEANRVVCSTGFQLLDFYLGGGYEESSYSVWYGACLHKDQHLDYVIYDGNRLVNSHGGTIDTLFHRFHNLKKGGLGHYPRNKIKDISFTILSYNESTGKAEHRKISNVFYNGRKQTYKVSFASGSSMIITGKHKLFTGSGYTELEKLSVGSTVYQYTRKSGEIHNSTVNHKNDRKEWFVKHHPSGSRKVVNGCTYYRVNIVNAIVEAHNNGVSLDEYRQGLNSGIQYDYFIPKGYEVHHVDYNRQNNGINNLQVLPRAEHMALHLNDRIEWSKGSIKETTITSITEHDFTDVYDIEVEGNHNYFIGGVLTHNSNLGKTSIVTAYLSAVAIRSGKVPLIISLEGSAQRLMKRILSILIGCWGQDISTLTDAQQQSMLELAKKLSNIPIVKSNAKSVYAMRRYINVYKPDIIIYDQLTISGGGREWTELSKVSEMLKKLTLDTGIPVIALTQSDGKNYGGEPAKKDEEGNEAVEYIKYAQAIFEDATTVVQIGKDPRNPETGRVLTLRKSKNDETAKLLPISIVIKMVETGFEEVGVKDGYKPLITPDKILSGKVSKQVKIVDMGELSPSDEVVSTYISSPTEIVVTDEIPSTFDCDMFSQKSIDTISDRLMSYSGFRNDQDLKILKYYLDNHKSNYGSEDDPTYGIKFYDVRELGGTYARYYAE